MENYPKRLVMVRKILLSLLVSAGGILNCMATVSEECKDFVTQIIEGMGRIQQSGRCNQEKVKRLMVLSNRVVEKMNEKPHRGKRTRKEKENDSAIRKRLENLYNKIQEALKKYPETDFPFYE